MAATQRQGRGAGWSQEAGWAESKKEGSGPKRTTRSAVAGYVGIVQRLVRILLEFWSLFFSFSFFTFVHTAGRWKSGVARGIWSGDDFVERGGRGHPSRALVGEAGQQTDSFANSREYVLRI